MVSNITKVGPQNHHAMGYTMEWFIKWQNMIEKWWHLIKDMMGI